MLDLGSVRIEWGTMIFQLIVFLILLLLVRIFAMKPAMSVLQKRQTYIEEQISSAELSRKEAEALISEQRALLEQAKLDAQTVLERAKKQSDAESQDIIQSAKDRADRIVEEARAEVVSEREKAVAVLRDEVAHLSVLLATKVLEREVDAKSHEKELEQFIQQAGDRL